MSGKNISEAMSWGFGAKYAKKQLSPPKQNLPSPLEQIEDIRKVEESSADIKKRKLTPTGRSSALLAGISNALKTRFGQ